MHKIFKSKNARKRKPTRRDRRPRPLSRAKEKKKTAARKRALKLGAMVVLPTLAIGAAYPYVKGLTEIVKPDLATNCYDLPDQKFTASLIDYSTTNLFTKPNQMQGLKIGFTDVHEAMSTNQKMDVFTTDKTTSNVVSPAYSVCKPASTAEQHQALQQRNSNIADKSQAQLTLKSDNAKKAFEKHVDQIIVDSQSTKGSFEKWDAPLLRRLKSLSRYYKDRDAQLDQLIMFSAGIEHSRDLQWCKTQGHLPSWTAFKKRPLYKEIKPFDSFKGMKVKFIMPEILQSYPQGKWCTQDEIKAFWYQYFIEAGASEVDIQPLQYRTAAMGAIGGWELGLMVVSVLRLLTLQKSKALS